MALSYEGTEARIETIFNLMYIAITVLVRYEESRQIGIKDLGTPAWLDSRPEVCLFFLPLCYVFVSVCFCAQIRAASSPQSDADVMSPFLSAVAVGQGPFSPWASSERARARAGPRCIHGGRENLRRSKSCEENAEDTSYKGLITNWHNRINILVLLNDEVPKMVKLMVITPHDQVCI